MKPGFIIDYDNWSYDSKLLINQFETPDDSKNYDNATSSRVLISSKLQDDCNIPAQMTPQQLMQSNDAVVNFNIIMNPLKYIYIDTEEIYDDNDYMLSRSTFLDMSI